MSLRIILFLLIVNTVNIFNGCASSNAQLSASTKFLMDEYNNAKKNTGEENNIILPENIVNDFAVRKVGNKYVTNVFITVNNNLIENELSGTDAKINTKTGNIWTIEIPLESLEALSAVKGVESIDVGIKSNNR